MTTLVCTIRHSVSIECADRDGVPTRAELRQALAEAVAAMTDAQLDDVWSGADIDDVIDGAAAQAADDAVSAWRDGAES